MLLDANLLLFAVDRESPFHTPAREWLSDVLNGDRRVGLPWQSLTAFLRIATHPSISRQPLGPDEAWQQIEDWLVCEVVWIPVPTERHAAVLGDLVKRHHLRGRSITDAQLAALAIEHGLTICSADTDFARFAEVRWENPLRAAPGRRDRIPT
jgi:toxin-antitoxin system PIN domain toxin